MDAYGSRRLFSLVTMLPADSALVTLLRPQSSRESAEPVAPRKPAGSWGDLAKALTDIQAAKKPRTKQGVS